MPALKTVPLRLREFIPPASVHGDELQCRLHAADTGTDAEYPQRCYRGRVTALGVQVLACVMIWFLGGSLLTSWTRLSTTTTTTTTAAGKGTSRTLLSLPIGDAACDDKSGGPAEVKGLEYCPQLRPLVPLMLETKRALLRLGLDASNGE